MNNTLDMTKGDPIKLTIKFMIPILIGILFQQVYNFVDTMMVGLGLGDEAVAAVGSTAALYSVLINFANGLSSGYNIVVARIFGENDYKRLRKAVATMFVLNFLITISLTIICLPLLSFFLKCLDTPSDIFYAAHQYIFIILAGMIATMSYNMCASFMQAVGNSKTPLKFLGLACLSNIIMDWLFIFVFKVGIAGAAIATVISQILSAILSFIFILRTYKEFLPRKEDFSFNSILFKEMFTMGLSMGLMMSAYSLGSIILQKGINNLGIIVITAHTAARRILEMLMMPLSALSIVSATFISQNFGAGKYDRIKQYFLNSVVIGIVWGLIAWTIIYVLGVPLLGLIISSKDTMTIATAMQNMGFTGFFYFPLAMLCTTRSILQAMDDKITPLMSGILELVVKIIFTICLVPIAKYFGVILAEPLIWSIGAVYVLVIYFIRIKKLI